MMVIAGANDGELPMQEKQLHWPRVPWIPIFPAAPGLAPAPPPAPWCITRTMPPTLSPLADERYISLESFKRDGDGVKTPVWAAPLDGKLVIATDGTSFKARRIRRNPRVRVAACDSRGTKIDGPWFDAECRVLEDPAHIERAIAVLQAKYGWQFSLFKFIAWISRRLSGRVILEVSIGSPA